MGYADYEYINEVRAVVRVRLGDMPTILRAMCLGSQPRDFTWGEWCEEFREGTGYIIVG